MKVQVVFTRNGYTLTMAYSYQMCVLWPEVCASKEVVPIVDEVLRIEGGAMSIEEEGTLQLTGDEGFEIIHKPEEALRRLAESPALGTLLYWLYGLDAVVFYGEKGNVQAIEIITPETLNELPSEESERYKRIGGKLHKMLGARRTVMDYGLREQGRDVEFLLKDIQRHEDIGKFKILDLA